MGRGGEEKEDGGEEERAKTRDGGCKSGQGQMRLWAQHGGDAIATPRVKMARVW